MTTMTITEMTNTEHWKRRFDEMVNHPLAGVVGKCLHRVSFAVLSSDYADFDANNPNASGGCQAVILYFDDFRLVIGWASKPEFTEGVGGIMFHIMPYLVSSSLEIMQYFGEHWKELPADSTPSWKNYIGCELKQVVVFREVNSPQALQFSFSPGEVVLAVGSTYDYPSLHIGDGNEILHLDSHQLSCQWQAT